jgi:hypothetical protein
MGAIEAAGNGSATAKWLITLDHLNAKPPEQLWSAL